MVPEGHEARRGRGMVIGATNPLKAASGLDPRRVRARDRLNWSRFGLRRVGPTARRGSSSRAADAPVASVLGHARAQRARSSAARVRSSSARDVVEGGRARPRPSPARTRCARRGRRGPRGRVVLGLDTLVATELEIWGKPPNAGRARRCGAARGAPTASQRRRAVRGRRSSRATATPRSPSAARRRADRVVRGCGDGGRAGGYAIQGRGGALVGCIEGDYLQRRRPARGDVLGLGRACST
jgi:septum formation protein